MTNGHKRVSSSDCSSSPVSYQQPPSSTPASSPRATPAAPVTPKTMLDSVVGGKPLISISVSKFPPDTQKAKDHEESKSFWKKLFSINLKFWTWKLSWPWSKAKIESVQQAPQDLRRRKANAENGIKNLSSAARLAIITACREYLSNEQERALIQTQGIFRLAPKDEDSIGLLEEAMNIESSERPSAEKEILSFSIDPNTDIHIVTNLMKKAAYGLLDENDEQGFMNINSVNSAKSLISLLDKEKVKVLKDIFVFFNIVSKQNEVNLMIPRNLAIVIVPNLFPVTPSKSPDPTKAFATNEIFVDSAKYFIEHALEIFTHLPEWATRLSSTEEGSVMPESTVSFHIDTSHER